MAVSEQVAEARMRCGAEGVVSSRMGRLAEVWKLYRGIRRTVDCFWGESFLMLAESELGPAKYPGRHELCKGRRNP